MGNTVNRKQFMNALGNMYVPEKFLTFDDVLLVPQKTYLKSRKQADVRVIDINLPDNRHPIIPANMDTISGEQVVLNQWNTGGIGILHRFWEDDSKYANVIAETAERSLNGIGFSIGIGENQSLRWIVDTVHRIIGVTNTEEHTDRYPIIICLDVAHGDSACSVEKLRLLRDHTSQWDHWVNVKIIAGNIATGRAFKNLVDAGADYVKVGIGPGGMCQTRTVAGHGVPQLSAIMDVAAYRNAYTAEHNRYIPIIADGGIRTSGDIVKAIAAGADYVMAGSVFAGCTETPGESTEVDGKLMKSYRGQASRKFMEEAGKLGRAPEGASAYIECKGSIDSIMEDLLGGLRSGMSYSGARVIEQFQNNSIMVEISTAGIVEGGAHTLNQNGVREDS